MSDKKLVTIDAVFADLDNLKASVEETRKILDNENRVLGYYLMDYTDSKTLGIKVIVKDSDISEVSTVIKEKLTILNGFNKISQEKTEGEPTEESYLSCIAMRTRNEIFDLFKGEVSGQNYNQILSHLVHYISNPLLFGYRQEFVFCLNHLLLLYDSKK